MVHSYQQNKSDTISTLVEAVNVEALQDALALRRNVFIQGYLSQDFKAIETTLADNFRFVNGKAIHNRDSWHEILHNLWQSRDWQSQPLLPDRVRYHFFSLTECMITLYYKHEPLANVMQELWMQDDNVWRLSAVSIVNR